MTDQPFIDRVLAEIRQRLPGELDSLGTEVERNLRAVLGEAIQRLDLISREEFDIQQQVLARTRARLEALEKEVSRLEQQLEDE